MTPNSPSAAQFWHWNSPLPYLFAGLSLMVLLIAAALIILACSFRKRYPPHDDAERGSGEKSVHVHASAAVSDDTPRIVVIMAGDDNPSRLAIPVPSSSSNDCGV